MTYEELVKKLKSNFEGMDAGKIKEHLAIQFNVAGEAEGALYMEIRDGKVMIEPYEYYDRDAIFTGTAKLFTEIMTGKKDPVHEFLCLRLKVEGNIDKALKLKDLIERNQK